MTATIGNENLLRLSESVAGWHDMSARAETRRQRAREYADMLRYRQDPFDALCDDLQWLLDSGCGIGEITTRLGYRNPESLMRRLDRAGRNDLSRRLRPLNLDQSKVTL